MSDALLQRARRVRAILGVIAQVLRHHTRARVLCTCGAQVASADFNRHVAGQIEAAIHDRAGDDAA